MGCRHRSVCQSILSSSYVTFYITFVGKVSLPILLLKASKGSFYDPLISNF
jgi:hypothetical protein